MKIYGIALILSFFIFTGCSEKKDEEQHMHNKQEIEKDMTQMKHSETEQVIYYTCPMESHKHIHSDTTGKCPECNMELVKVVITSEEKMEFFGCPMESHSHVRKIKPGKCEECGMDLKPMHLVKN